MSHFGLQGALPVVEATPVAEKVYYGLYEWQKRSYYEGGSSKSEHLLAIHEDPDALRTQMNAIWENSDLFEIRGKYQMVIKEGEFETNTWYHDGGGCGASGGYHIKAVPSLNQHLMGLKGVIQKAQAERDRLAEEKRRYDERQEEQRILAAEQKAYWEERRIINAKHRAWRAANKDEVNAKQRAYRKKVREAAKEAAAQRELAWKQFNASILDWELAHPGQRISDKAYYALHKKYTEQAKVKK